MQKHPEKRSIHLKIILIEISVHKTVRGGRVVALNRNLVSTRFNQIVNILRKISGKEHELSALCEKMFRRLHKIRKQNTKKYENKLGDCRKINKQHFEN